MRVAVAIAAAVVLLISIALALSGALSSSRFDGRRAFRDLTEIATRGHRSYGAQDRGAALDAIIERFRPSVDAVETQEVPVLHPDTGALLVLKNVLLRQHTERVERVILASHWDTRLWAEEDPVPARRGEPIMGANDGTSGIALLIELARITKTEPLGFGIDFVLFDGEEYGRPGNNDYCQGSRAFAQDLGGFYPKGLPRFGLVFDMVADKNLGIRKERHSVEAAGDLVEMLWSVAALDHEASAFIPELGFRIYDDHVPLIQAGVPTALLIDFDYPHWHTQQDTPEQCSAESLRRVGQVVVDLLAKVSAEHDATPKK